MISAKFVPLKYYTLSSQLQRLTSFSVGCSGRRILSPGQIAVMRKWSIDGDNVTLESMIYVSLPTVLLFSLSIKFATPFLIYHVFDILNKMRYLGWCIHQTMK